MSAARQQLTTYRRYATQLREAQAYARADARRYQAALAAGDPDAIEKARRTLADTAAEVERLSRLAAKYRLTD